MAVGFAVNHNWYEAGTEAFLVSFFSTVVCRLENNQRGSRFPLITHELYFGHLPARKVKNAKKELEIIRRELKKHKVSELVLDMDDFSKIIPLTPEQMEKFKDNPLSFITSDGVNLLDKLNAAFDDAIKVRTDVEIVLL